MQTPDDMRQYFEPDGSPRRMTDPTTIEYIAASPSYEHGGFDAQTVAAAKVATATIAGIRAELAEVRAILGGLREKFHAADQEFRAAVRAYEAATGEDAFYLQNQASYKKGIRDALRNLLLARTPTP